MGHKTIVAFPLNKSETIHINNNELLVLVLVPKNIAKFSTTENKQTGGSRNRAWTVLCLSVVWSLGGNL